jgi:hypothetical protein
VQLAGYYGIRLRTAGVIMDLAGDYAQINGSYRAPIYYDSNNTAYYFDGASTSNWNTSVQDGFHTFNNYGLGIVGTYSATRYQLVWALGNAYKGNADGTSLSGAYGLWFSYPAAGGPAANLSTHGLMLIENGAFRASLDPSMRAVSDMRAPIFYDYDNTARYFDGTTGFNLTTGASGRVTIYTDDSGLHVYNAENIPTTVRLGAGYNLPGVYSNGNLNLIGESRVSFRISSTERAFISGNDFTCVGNVTAYSDARLKANVETIPRALDKLDQIRGVTYTRTDLEDTERRYAGVIAQEIEAVLPEAVRDHGDIKAVDYNATIGLLIQAVKELRDEVEALRK